MVFIDVDGFTRYWKSLDFMLQSVMKYNSKSWCRLLKLSLLSCENLWINPIHFKEWNSLLRTLNSTQLIQLSCLSAIIRCHWWDIGSHRKVWLLKSACWFAPGHRWGHPTALRSNSCEIFLSWRALWRRRGWNKVAVNLFVNKKKKKKKRDKIKKRKITANRFRVSVDMERQNQCLRQGPLR